MTSEKFLDYEMTLLLARYGERPVLSALARKLGLPAEELENKLHDLSRLKPRKKRPVKSRMEPAKLLEPLLAQHPQKAESLKILFTRFQNKTFLPELRELKRFLERNSPDVHRVKSRAEALPQLLKVLGNLDAHTLANLCREPEPLEYSSLRILSEEIMRRAK